MVALVLICLSALARICCLLYLQNGEGVFGVVGVFFCFFGGDFFVCWFGFFFPSKSYENPKVMENKQNLLDSL